MKPSIGIVVDGSCCPNPGAMEWQGVCLASGKKLFRYGPIRNGTNNVAEFLAIVHALSISDILTIYTDSSTAMAWVRNGEGKAPATASETVKDLVRRANVKLQTLNDSYRRLRYWDKIRWGENPADFGRK
ncbi:RNase H family protein [Larkinella soli]|uniref:RNase H family protein n=1 Tax=Larkinella soli TaxID=1770527 RepID=UPI000FFC7552|nr:RNase H family protein [Larkinella soli]